MLQKATVILMILREFVWLKFQVDHWLEKHSSSASLVYVCPVAFIT